MTDEFAVLGGSKRIRAAASDDRPIYFWVAEATRPPPESRYPISKHIRCPRPHLNHIPSRDSGAARRSHDLLKIGFSCS